MPFLRRQVSIHTGGLDSKPQPRTVNPFPSPRGSPGRSGIRSRLSRETASPTRFKSSGRSLKGRETGRRRVTDGRHGIDPLHPALPMLIPEPDVVRPSSPSIPRTSRGPRPTFPRPWISPLPVEPSLFEWLGRRFAPSEATLFIGPARALESLLELAYVGCVSAGGRISLLEESNRFHPFRVGEWARSTGVDPGEALGAIRIAGAFTGYQMASLVDGWTQEIRRSRPTLLVAHDIPAMFFEAEFPVEEREPLLRHVAKTLAETLLAPLGVTRAFLQQRWRLVPASGRVRYRSPESLAQRRIGVPVEPL